MFRNYLAAALRNLARNRLCAAINIVGLSVGFATALLIGLFVAASLVALGIAMLTVSTHSFSWRARNP